MNNDCFLATVTSVSGSKVRLKFDGQDNESAKYYSSNNTLQFAVGDRVMCRNISGTIVVEYAISGATTIKESATPYSNGNTVRY